LGSPFEAEAFLKWLNLGDNFAVFDGDAKNYISEEIKTHKNVIVKSQSAGWSQQTQQRLSDKVLENIENFLESDNTSLRN
jgi:phosphoglycerate dehydrogenase-like enzyme